METETEKIFKEQLEKLPASVVDFISSASWDTDVEEIGSLYNLSEKALSDFTREVNFVLMGIIHPDEFSEVLEQELEISGETLGALVANVEEKIFAPIRPALIEFFEKEEQKEAEQIRASAAEAPQEELALKKPRIQMPDLAPDNLPVADEVEPLIPPIPQKILSLSNLETRRPNYPDAALDVGQLSNVEPPHPFEEKMKRVFTAGTQQMGDLAIESPTAQMGGNEPLTSPKQTPPPIYHVDPYREAIE